MYFYFRIGTFGAEMRQQKQCHRCVIVNVDPETGEVDPKGEPLKTLIKYRPFPFGNDPIMAKAQLSPEQIDPRIVDSNFFLANFQQLACSKARGHENKKHCPS